jgi:hypothetical protein
LAKEIVNSRSSLIELFRKFYSAWLEHRYLRVTWTTKKDRTLDQNALWASLYQRIAETLDSGTAQDISARKAYCKLMLGLPIMRRDSERFDAGWNQLFRDKGYQYQIFIMGPNPLFGSDGFPITRLFDTKQGAEYTDAVVDHFSQQGVFFEDLLEGKRAA